MSYDYVLALVEECHRFEEKAYTRVSLEELVGNRKLIDEYAALLFRTVNRFGRRSGQPRAERARHGTGRGVASAADAPLSPERADLPQGYAAGAEGQRMTGGAAAGVGPWKPLCFPFARGRQLLRRR